MAHVGCRHGLCPRGHRPYSRPLLPLPACAAARHPRAPAPTRHLPVPPENSSVTVATWNAPFAGSRAHVFQCEEPVSGAIQWLGDARTLAYCAHRSRVPQDPARSRMRAEPTVGPVGRRACAASRAVTRPSARSADTVSHGWGLRPRCACPKPGASPSQRPMQPDRHGKPAVWDATSVWRTRVSTGLRLLPLCYHSIPNYPAQRASRSVRFVEKTIG